MKRVVFAGVLGVAVAGWVPSAGGEVRLTELAVTGQPAPGARPGEDFRFGEIYFVQVAPGGEQVVITGVGTSAIPDQGRAAWRAEGLDGPLSLLARSGDEADVGGLVGRFGQGLPILVGLFSGNRIALGFDVSEPVPDPAVPYVLFWAGPGIFDVAAKFGAVAPGFEPDTFESLYQVVGASAANMIYFGALTSGSADALYATTDGGTPFRVLDAGDAVLSQGLGTSSIVGNVNVFGASASGAKAMVVTTLVGGPFAVPEIALLTVGPFSPPTLVIGDWMAAPGHPGFAVAEFAGAAKMLPDGRVLVGARIADGSTSRNVIYRGNSFADFEQVAEVSRVAGLPEGTQILKIDMVWPLELRGGGESVAAMLRIQKAGGFMGRCLAVRNSAGRFAAVVVDGEPLARASGPVVQEIFFTENATSAARIGLGLLVVGGQYSAVLLEHVERRPRVKVAGKRRIVAVRSRVRLRGTARDPDGRIEAVFVKTGTRRAKRARGTARWRAVVRARPGRTRVQVWCVDEEGLLSPRTRRAIIRTRA